MKSNTFPSNKTLEEAVLKSIKELGGSAQVPQINNKVIEILHLPKEVVELEDESGLGTKLEYRLRWARTNLKSKGKIRNVIKGTWEVVEE